MLGQYFYHEILRKTVIGFGTLFNGIEIRHDADDGGNVSRMKVPLAYGPMQKFLAKIEQQPTLKGRPAITLPRMSFEIVDISYDLTRQLTKVSNFNTQGSSVAKRQKFFSPVPYNIGFSLSIYAKNQDDALQLVEQILPTFNPQYTLSIFPFKDIYPDFVEDVPIVITSVTFEDDYQSTLEQRRTIVYNLTFEMKVQFYGDIENKDVIRTSNAKLFNMNAGLNDSDIYLERVTVTPNPTTVFGMPDSDFGFTTAIVSAGDSL